MDHLAPSSGVNWYTSYNAFGELLAATPQLPLMELGGMDEGQPYNLQGHMHYPTQDEGVHYEQELSHPNAVGVEEEYLFAEKTLPLAQSRAASGVRVAVGEKIACLECGATFACGANLRNHMRIHTGERPFVCEECGASFTQRSNMRSHKRVHTGERPYMCGICGQTFARSSHLPGHMRTHTGEKPFSCHQCGRSFATNQIMKNHMRTHTGERPFVCDVCDATFAQSSCLATHKKIHTGERKFKCGRCGKAFISRSGLQTHERVHTGEKPFNCERCDKSFRTSSYLSKHRQKYCGYENCVKVNKQLNPGEIKKSVNSHRLSKCKKSLKQPSRPPSKRSKSKRTQRPKRNSNGAHKREPTSKSGCCKLLEEDIDILEKKDLNGENCHNGNGSGMGDGLHVRFSNEVVPAANNQEEGIISDCKPELDEEAVLATPFQDVLLRQENVDIKVEDGTFIHESNTGIPQDGLTGSNGILQVPGLQKGNLCEETEPPKEPFQDMSILNKSHCCLSDSQPPVLQPQGQDTGAQQLIENYFEEINGASFSEGAYKEEILGPAVMDAQPVCEGLPQPAGSGTAAQMPRQAYAVKNGSPLWYSM